MDNNIIREKKMTMYKGQKKEKKLHEKSISTHFTAWLITSKGLVPACM